MSIVFDEVVGEVLPEGAPPREQERQADTAPRPPDPELIRREIRRAEQRAARLRAD